MDSARVKVRGVGEGCLGWYILMSGLINLVTPISLEVDPVPLSRPVDSLGGRRKKSGGVGDQSAERKWCVELLTAGVKADEALQPWPLILSRTWSRYSTLDPLSMT